MPGFPDGRGTGEELPAIQIPRNLAVLRAFAIPVAMAISGLWLGIEGGAEQVRLDAPPLVWAETYAGTALWGLLLTQMLIRMASPTRLVITADSLILRGAFRRLHLRWADIEWIGVLPAEGESGTARRSRCPADILILLKTQQPELRRQPRGSLRWDPHWGGVRFSLTHLAITPRQFDQLMNTYAGTRWHGARTLPVTADTAGAVLSIPGHLCTPLITTLKNASMGIGLLFCIICSRIYVSPDSFASNSSTEGQLLLVMAATASSSLIIINAFMIIVPALISSRCWMKITSEGIELRVRGFQDRLEWQTISKLEISATGPRSRRRNTPWAVTAHLKPGQPEAHYSKQAAKWSCFTTQSTGVMQIVPVCGVMALHYRHGLGVFPEQLAEALGEFQGPVPVSGPEQGSKAEMQWRGQHAAP